MYVPLGANNVPLTLEKQSMKNLLEKQISQITFLKTNILNYILEKQIS